MSPWSLHAAHHKTCHKRLKGRLIFAINEEWTLTEEGLESQLDLT